jgi:lipopolysaccharide transport system permease protein
MLGITTILNVITKGKKMANTNADEIKITIIQPKPGWQLINFSELVEYRDLCSLLVWRNVKVLYAQTILGLLWALLQPLIQIVIFTVVFGKLAKISTEGIPYMLFATVAIIPWNYMSVAMTQSSQSLVTGQNMLGKIYFPRLLFPLTPILARLVDFGISLLLLMAVAAYYQVTPTWNLLFFPLFLIQMMCISFSVGTWLSPMSIRYRDVNLAMPFVIRMLMYTAPIVYSAASIPDKYRIIYSLNPVVGVVEGFRACLLGTPMPWAFIWPGMIVTAILLIGGLAYFKSKEYLFVDVI